MSQVKIRDALELALNAMPGLIPEVSILSSSGGTFTTATAHGLTSGICVVIENHTGANGFYEVDVQNDFTFAILDPTTDSGVDSSGFGGTVKAQLTHWQDTSFDPFVNVPFQQVYVMFADPDNPTYGDNFYREIGIFQINLYYPKDRGSLDIETRAMLIRDTFKRGSVFVKDDINVDVLKTPSISHAPNVDNYTCRIVKISFKADVFPQ